MARRNTSPRKWAPSARDQEIYLRVQRDGRTQRQAAAEFGVSQPRVFKIVAKVEDWLQTYQTRHVGKFSPQERINYVRWNYTQVIDKLWRECMATWNQSLEDEEYFEERIKDGKRIRIAITRPAKARLDCLKLAIRCTDELSRLKGFDPDAWIKANQQRAKEESLKQAQAAAYEAALEYLRAVELEASNSPVELSSLEEEACVASEAEQQTQTPTGAATCSEPETLQNDPVEAPQPGYQFVSSLDVLESSFTATRSPRRRRAGSAEWTMRDIRRYDERIIMRLTGRTINNDLRLFPACNIEPAGWSRFLVFGLKVSARAVARGLKTGATPEIPT